MILRIDIEVVFVKCFIQITYNDVVSYR